MEKTSGSRLDMEDGDLIKYEVSCRETFSCSCRIRKNVGTNATRSHWSNNKFKILTCVESSGENAQCHQRMNAVSKKCLVEGYSRTWIDVPWKVMCLRLMDQVHAVFMFRSEDWSWISQTMEETKTMTRLSSLKRHKDETWVRPNQNMQYEQKDVGADGTVFGEKISESMWRVMGRNSDENRMLSSSPSLNFNSGEIWDYRKSQKMYVQIRWYNRWNVWWRKIGWERE